MVALRRLALFKGARLRKRVTACEPGAAAPRERGKAGRVSGEMP